MNSRERILASIKNNKPSMAELPVITIDEVIQYDNLVAQFITTLNGIGGTVVEIDDLQQLKTMIEEESQAGKYIINALGPTRSDLNNLSAQDLAKVDKAYIKGSIAVAENGSVWLYESQMINRLLPFICQHLVLVIEKKNIVATMHHAYQKIDTSLEGFGVFLAGPSKTADIEQSLVIGAHGARSLVLYLLE